MKFLLFMEFLELWREGYPLALLRRIWHTCPNHDDTYFEGEAVLEALASDLASCFDARVPVRNARCFVTLWGHLGSRGCPTITEEVVEVGFTAISCSRNYVVAGGLQEFDVRYLLRTACLPRDLAPNVLEALGSA